MTTKVYVTDFVNDELEPEREIFGDIANVIAVNAQSQEDLFGVIEDADALMVYHMIHVDQKLINQLNRCKIIVRCGVGFDNVDYKYFFQKDLTKCDSNAYWPRSASGTTLRPRLSGDCGEKSSESSGWDESAPPRHYEPKHSEWMSSFTTPIVPPEQKDPWESAALSRCKNY